MRVGKTKSPPAQAVLGLAVSQLELVACLLSFSVCCDWRRSWPLPYSSLEDSLIRGLEHHGCQRGLSVAGVTKRSEGKSCILYPNVYGPFQPTLHEAGELHIFPVLCFKVPLALFSGCSWQEAHADCVPGTHLCSVPQAQRAWLPSAESWRTCTALPSCLWLL